MMKITEIDYTTTPETITERDMTADELAQWKADKAIREKEIKDLAARATAKAALLERLGITEEEAALLLG
jgi:hypothetical protein